MQVSVEITSGLGRRLTIGVPAQRVESEVDSRLQKAAQSVRLKGFRPGKVPMKVVRQRFGAGVRQEVLGEVMSQTFYEAVSQEDLRPAGQPEIEPRSMDAGKDIEYVATFEIYPEVALPDFSKVTVQKPTAEVSDEDVEKMIDVLRNQQASWTEVEREAKDGDQVNIDYKGTKDGEAFDGGSAEGSNLVLGSGRMIAGFEAGIEGMKAGETRTLDLTFPEEYHSEELKGQAVQFEITVNSVSEKTQPELNDEFFAMYGVDEGGLDAFKTEVKSNMERELRNALKNKLKSRVLDSLAALVEVEVPKALLSQEINALRQQSLRQFGAAAGNFDASMLPDELFSEQAEKRVKLGLLLGEAIKKEELTADADKVRAMVEEVASTYEQPQEVIDWYYGNREQMAGVEAAVLEDQVIEAILDKATVEEQACSYEEALRPDPQQDVEE